MSRLINIFLLLLLIAGGLFSVSASSVADARFFSTIKTRAFGMGGAYSAVIDGAASSVFNPANSGFSLLPSSQKISVLVTPIDSYLSLVRYNDLKIKNGSPSGLDWLYIFGLAAKSIMYSQAAFRAILVLTEMLPENPAMDQGTDKIIPLDGILDWNYSTLSMSLRLAQKISIGASGYLISTNDSYGPENKAGASYGVAIQPSQGMTIGVAYFDFNNSVAHLFERWERTVDETINVGVSFRPVKNWLIASDIKNFTEDQKAIEKEVHLGTEITIGSMIALRAGFYNEKNKQNAYSFGLGLLGSKIFAPPEYDRRNNEFLLNYSIQLYDNNGEIGHSHFLVMNLRI